VAQANACVINLGLVLDLKEMGWEVVVWMHLAQDRDQLWALVNMVMNLRVL
jgi:hypothetical protein